MKSIDVTAKINDLFWRLQNSTWKDEDYFFDRSTAKRFEVGTDFRTYKSVLPYMGYNLEYNFQMQICGSVVVTNYLN